MKNPLSPAFPVYEETTDRIDEGILIYSGLTKREYFAAKAMQGLVSNQEFLKNLNADTELVVTAILEMTDKLLKELGS